MEYMILSTLQLQPMQIFDHTMRWRTKGKERESSNVYRSGYMENVLHKTSSCLAENAIQKTGKYGDNLFKDL